MRLLLIIILLSVSLFSTSRVLHLKKFSNEKRVALVIGNANYEGPLKLKNPIHDATDVKNALEKVGFEVLFLLNANQIQIDEALKEFKKKLDKSGVGFFYFAGHGLEMEQKNYLVPIGANINAKYQVKYRTLPVEQIVTLMRNSHTRLNMIVLDACRNDPFSRGGGGLAPVITAKGTLIAYATSPGSVAADGNERNGLFTKYFLKAIKEKNIHQREFFHEIRLNVYRESDGRQIPYLNDGTLGDFYFNIDTGYHNEISNQTNKVDADEMLWREIEFSKNYTDFKFFINNYPNSKYISIAKFKLKKLEPKQKNKSFKPYSAKIYKDSSTNLKWQVNVKNRKYTYKSAKRYCKRLRINNESGWRLPTLSELKTLVTLSAYKNQKSFNRKSYIKKELLESTKMSYPWFWSSTLNSDNYTEAWLVNFSTKEINKLFTSGESYVRCVKK